MTIATGNGPSVCGVIVTYHPDLSVLQTLLDAIQPQTGAVVVIDNGSSGEAVVWLGRQQQAGRLELVLLQDNLGIAAAQNRGIRRAQELGCSHVLLLDQDSIPAADMVVRLLAAERYCADRGEPVGAVGPRFIDPVTGVETWFHGRGPLRYRYLKCPLTEAGSVVRADLLIASGMLVRCEVFAVVGIMDEALFIDLVDTEWCLRAAAAGYGIFGVCNALMHHSIGSRSATVPAAGGRRGTFPLHPPQRYYYMARNSMLLSLRAAIPFWWKLNNGMELLFLLLLLPVAAERRFASLSLLIKGALDGLCGGSGRFDGAGRMAEKP